MATNMKTIKFGENGEVYAVNAPAVSVSGELTESAQEIDFGTFDGLTEAVVVVRGVADTPGDYTILNINGTDVRFVTSAGAYKSVLCVTFKKIGSLWSTHWFSADAGYKMEWTGNFYDSFESLESITSLKVKAYSGTHFAAGTKYALEGR